MENSPEEMAGSLIDNLPEKTGRPWEEWLDVVRSSGTQKHGQIVRMLQADHKMTHGYANLVAHEFLPRVSGGSPT